MSINKRLPLLKSPLKQMPEMRTLLNRNFKLNQPAVPKIPLLVFMASNGFF